MRLALTRSVLETGPSARTSQGCWRREVGGGGGLRTHDLLFARQPLCLTELRPREMDDGSGIAPLESLVCGQPDSPSFLAVEKLVEPEGVAPSPQRVKAACAELLNTTTPNWYARRGSHPDLRLGGAACCSCTTRASKNFGPSRRHVARVACGPPEGSRFENLSKETAEGRLASASFKLPTSTSTAGDSRRRKIVPQRPASPFTS